MQYSLSCRGEKKIGHERKLGGVPIYPFSATHLIYCRLHTHYLLNFFWYSGCSLRVKSILAIISTVKVKDVH